MESLELYQTGAEKDCPWGSQNHARLGDISVHRLQGVVESSFLVLWHHMLVLLADLRIYLIYGDWDGMVTSFCLPPFFRNFAGRSSHSNPCKSVEGWLCTSTQVQLFLSKLFPRAFPQFYLTLPIGITRSEHNTLPTANRISLRGNIPLGSLQTIGKMLSLDHYGCRKVVLNQSLGWFLISTFIPYLRNDPCLD